MSTAAKRRILRFIVELLIFIALFWWLPFWYQFLAAIAWSLLLEFGYSQWLSLKLRRALSAEAIQRMSANFLRYNEEKRNANT